MAGQLGQVMLGEGEGNAGEGVHAQTAFLVAECTCCSLRAGLATSTHSAALPRALTSRHCTWDVVKSVAAPWRALARAVC